MYAQVVDNKIVSTGLPRALETPNGKTVNFARAATPEKLAEHGFLEVVDIPPKTDENHQAVPGGIELVDGIPTRIYEIVDRPPVVPEPDVDGFLDDLDDALPRATSRALLRDYPDIHTALSRGRFARAWEALTDAVQAGDVSMEQVEQIQTLAEQHHIPAGE